MPRLNQMTAVALSDILGFGLGVGGCGLEGHALAVAVVALLASLPIRTASSLQLFLPGTDDSAVFIVI